WIDEWDTYWVEIWLSTPRADSVGVASAEVDLAYDTACFTPVTIEYGPAFTESQTGIVDDAAGIIHELGAGTTAAAVGDGRYVLLARVCLDSSLAADASGLLIEHDAYAAASPCGVIASAAEATLSGGIPAEVALGDPSATELWPVMYDLDDDGRVGLGDLSYFAAAYHHEVGEPGASYTWVCDFDHDGVVGLGDLSYFAAAYRHQYTDLGPMPYPASFPTAWRPGTAAAGLSILPAAGPASTSPASSTAASFSQKAALAHDAALVGAYGSVMGKIATERQHLGWLDATFRRNPSSLGEHRLAARRSAIDLLFAFDQT
ncbi:MAG: hypothetical protein JXB13_17055, partial [Phycisphaerae bacterium]|nr:hypothetical protein [Phycisphaerae bacterium]